MLQCPNCGAAAKPSDVCCGYCRASLQTIACAACLGMNFRGAPYCSHCGAQTIAAGAETSGPHECPRCRGELSISALGGAFLETCSRCGGVWVDTKSFAEICRSKEEQAAYVGAGSPQPPPSSLGAAAQAEAAVRYLRCPLCRQVMNRMNFARHSGVIVDVCKSHGTWFDRDELHRIVVFIQEGGLDAARERQRAALAVEEQRLRERERALRPEGGLEADYSGALAAVGDLLRWLG